MNFIPELPNCEGYNNILVIMDKLTKYAIFIPTSTSITEKGTAERHVIAKFRILRQVIMDRDIHWTGEFWKEISNQMGVKRSLTTAYQPQAKQQTKVLQALEISLHGYIRPSRVGWVLHLNALAFSDNSTPHSAMILLHLTYFMDILQLPSPRFSTPQNLSQGLPSLL